MTRGEMEDEVGAEMSSHLGDAASRDPIAKRRAVWRAVDEIAERTDCLHKGRLLSIVAEQASYCPTGLRRVTAVSWKNAAGDWYGNLPVRTSHEMDKGYPYWRNHPTSDNAQVLVVTGPNRVTVWPTPSVSRAGAIRFEGYWKPGEIWNHDAITGADIAPARSDVCPLPSYAITAAIERAKWYFAKALRVKNPAIAPIIGDLDRESTRLIGIVESDTAKHWQALGKAPRSLWRG